MKRPDLETTELTQYCAERLTYLDSFPKRFADSRAYHPHMIRRHAEQSELSRQLERIRDERGL